MMKMNCIDSGSGVSFAEALSICETFSKCKTKKKSANSNFGLKKCSMDTYHGQQQERDARESDHDTKLETMDLHIKHKFYSITKLIGKVGTLFDLCVKVLQQNIGALEYTGGVPYSVLQPVMKTLTPYQLFNLEDHNPYLIEDTDPLWKFHCQKEFPFISREDMESWREMYIRCSGERESKLNVITERIRQFHRKTRDVKVKLVYSNPTMEFNHISARQQKRKLKRKKKLGTRTVLKKRMFY